MKKFNGDIILGIKDKTYDGNWEAFNGTVTYTFAQPLPLFGTKMTRTYSRYSPLLPYELGGQMVNEIVKQAGLSSAKTQNNPQNP